MQEKCKHLQTIKAKYFKFKWEVKIQESKAEFTSQNHSLSDFVKSSEIQRVKFISNKKEEKSERRTHFHKMEFSALKRTRIQGPHAQRWNLCVAIREPSKEKKGHTPTNQILDQSAHITWERKWGERSKIRSLPAQAQTWKTSVFCKEQWLEICQHVESPYSMYFSFIPGFGVNHFFPIWHERLINSTVWGEIEIKYSHI